MAVKTIYFERDLLYDLYVTRGLTTNEVGAELGVSSAKIRMELVRHGIARRTSHPGRRKYEGSSAEIRRLYEREGLAIWQIVDRLALSHQAVYKELVRSGVKIARRISRERPSKHFDRDLLYDLYAVQGLSRVEISSKLGVNVSKVTNEFKRYGITGSMSSRPRPGTRTDLDMAEIKRLYKDEGLSTTKIGARLGVSKECIRKRLRSAGVPRKAHGPWARKYHKIYDLKPNETVIIPRPKIAYPLQTLHATARYIGIKIVIEEIDESRMRVKRIR